VSFSGITLKFSEPAVEFLDKTCGRSKADSPPAMINPPKRRYFLGNSVTEESWS
jgi:hypothetical protein